MRNAARPKPVLPAADTAPRAVEGGLEAPIIFFDEVSALGFSPGVGRILLCAVVQEVDADGKIVARKKAVAQLRGNGIALEQIRSAVEQLQVMNALQNGRLN